MDMIVRSMASDDSASLVMAWCLQRLDHAYPYHQAIGFLLERAGRPNADCQKFEALGKEFDFYLDYGMKRPVFNKKWRLHYPASLD
jgi:hypothetical protein